MWLLLSSVACAPSTIAADEAEACVRDGSLHLIFHPCLSSSCSPILSVACEGTVDGSRWTVDGAATIGNPMRNACTDDCQVASCDLGPAGSAITEVSWAGEVAALADLPACAEIDGGWAL